MALQSFPATQLLPLKVGHSTFRMDFLFFAAFLANTYRFAIGQIFFFLLTIFNNESNRVIWNNVNIAIIKLTPPSLALSCLDQILLSLNTNSFINTSKFRKYVHDVLKVKLGLDLYIRVSRFYKAFFGKIKGLETVAVAIFVKCQKNNNLLYIKELS